MDNDQVTVRTQDGSVYTGDIVVGADGVHSTVRQEMWRNALESNSGLFKQDEVNGAYLLDRQWACYPKAS